MSLTFAIPVLASTTPPISPVVRPYDPIAYNCYLYIQTLIVGLPMTSQIVPNSIYPTVSGITILEYHGVLHYVKNLEVTELGEWIKESNFIAGEYTTRFLSWEYLLEYNAQYWYPLE